MKEIKQGDTHTHTHARTQQLLDNLDRDMQYAITHDAGWAAEDCDNYQEVCVCACVCVCVCVCVCLMGARVKRALGVSQGVWASAGPPSRS